MCVRGCVWVCLRVSSLYIRNLIIRSLSARAYIMYYVVAFPFFALAEERGTCAAPQRVLFSNSQLYAAIEATSGERNEPSFMCRKPRR